MPQQSGYGQAPQHPGQGQAPHQPGYGPAPQQSGYGQAPQQSGYGQAPHQPGYGQAPQQPGYGPAPQQPPGYPQQPGYPPPGYGQPQQYQPGYPPYPAQPPFQSGPSAVTAIIAGILAILGGLRGTVGAIAIPFLDIDSDFDPSGFWRKLQIVLLVSAAFSLVMLIGGILLFLRKKISRILIGVAGIATLALSIITSVAIYNHISEGGERDVYLNTDLSLLGAIGAAFNLAMVILVFLPSTGRWVAHRPNG